jgi:threonine dehydrogenase-like Zn-dependent dehydrogenase
MRAGCKCAAARADATYEFGEFDGTIRDATDGLGVELCWRRRHPEDEAAVDLVQVGGIGLHGLPPQKIAPIEAIQVTRARSRFAGWRNLPDDRNRALRLIAGANCRLNHLSPMKFALEQAEEAFATAASGPHASSLPYGSPEPDERIAKSRHKQWLPSGRCSVRLILQRSVGH